MRKEEMDLLAQERVGMDGRGAVDEADVDEGSRQWGKDRRGRISPS